MYGRRYQSLLYDVLLMTAIVEGETYYVALLCIPTCCDSSYFRLNIPLRQNSTVYQNSTDISLNT